MVFHALVASGSASFRRQSLLTMLGLFSSQMPMRSWVRQKRPLTSTSGANGSLMLASNSKPNGVRSTLMEARRPRPVGSSPRPANNLKRGLGKPLLLWMMTLTRPSTSRMTGRSIFSNGWSGQSRGAVQTYDLIYHQHDRRFF